MSAIGRNDPCPCGSGKKYKKCCLLRAAAASSAGDYTRAERDSAWAAVGRFASRPEFAGAVAAGETSFFYPALGFPGASVPGVREESRLFFEEWLLCDFHLRDERTAVDLFLDRERARLRSGELRYLERVRHAHLRPYEVTAVKPDEGLDLLDLWTGQRLHVRERAGTRQIVQWDVLAARIILGGESVPVLEGSPYLYPQEARAPIVKELKRGHRRLKRAIPDMTLPDFYILWLVYVRLGGMPRPVTVEGDPVVLARVVFDVRDQEALAAALAGHDDLDGQDDGSYAWLEDGGSEDFRRSLGTVVPQGKRLVVEATSRPRPSAGAP
jgi:SEC-C motif